MIDITLSYQIENTREVNIQKDSILEQVVIKFGVHKIDNGTDTVMCSDYNT